ncbi:MAG TPA: type II secretion system F family protein [Bryobacteraceae bacterium]|jgi:tight adherence protein B|nr:type II secretion system F family protein [Bryobacteraceae bacterium]
MSFILIVVCFWLVAVGVWMVVTKAFKNADVDKMKSRVLNTEEVKKKTKRTKDQNSPVQLIQSEDKTTGKVVLHLMRRFDLTNRLNNLLEQAGLKWRPARLVHSCLGLFLCAFLVTRYVIPVPYVSVQLLAGLFAGIIPVMYVLRVRNKRIHRFEEQFPESLEFVARSMRAGHAFSVSLEMLHREFQEPLSGEFRRTFDEHNLGLPLDHALLKLSKRVPILDVHFFVSAVLLQKRTGGNLAEILDKLAFVIRERFKLRGKIRAISAHGRLTGLALTLIPVGVAVLMFYANPEYVSFFIEDEIGNYMMGGAVFLQLVGYAIIRKIVSIEV